jgi:hypothetical protein
MESNGFEHYVLNGGNLALSFLMRINKTELLSEEHCETTLLSRGFAIVYFVCDFM